MKHTIFRTVQPVLVDQPNIEMFSIIFWSALFVNRGHPVTHSIREFIRVDATLNFEFKGHFEGHELNCGHNFGFNFRDELTST